MFEAIGHVYRAGVVTQCNAQGRQVAHIVQRAADVGVLSDATADLLAAMALAIAGVHRDIEATIACRDLHGPGTVAEALAAVPDFPAGGYGLFGAIADLHAEIIQAPVVIAGRAHALHNTLDAAQPCATDDLAIACAERVATACLVDAGHIEGGLGLSTTDIEGDLGADYLTCCVLPGRRHHYAETDNAIRQYKTATQLIQFRIAQLDGLKWVGGMQWKTGDQQA